MTLTTARRIHRAVLQRPKGLPFSQADFLMFGTRAAVDHALARLAKSGVIDRLSRGIYVRPAVNRYIGKVTPMAEAVLAAIGRKTGERVQVCGAKAAAEFGFTTQHPLVTPYDTTGTTRRLNAGGREIALHHCNARKMVLAGRPAGVGLAALWHLGPKRVDEAALARIEEVLDPREFRALRRVMVTQPAWLGAAFRRYQEVRPD